MNKSKRDTDWDMVEAQKRILRAKMGHEDYRAAQRAWARARIAQRQAWMREHRSREA